MEKAKSFFRRFWILLRERFPLASHLAMITAFVAANLTWAWASPSNEAGVEATPLKIVLCWIYGFSFFLRLRLFDEIKDLEVDKQLNPGRPLARGLLSVREVAWSLVFLIGLECVLAFSAGPAVLASALIGLLYSLLMFKEFFIGRFIRPHLTTYAVMHTAVSILMGACLGSIFLGVPIWEFSKTHQLLCLCNWAFFNLFEFARKTFAPGEEREGVESYSKVFGLHGSLVLSGSQVIAGTMLVAHGGSFIYLQETPWGIWGMALLPLLSSLAFALKPSVQTAKTFRAACGLYLVVFYLGSAVMIWLQ